MAEGDIIVYNDFKEQLFLGTHNLAEAAHSMIITLHTGYTPNIDTHQVWADTGVSSTEYTTGGNYTAGARTHGGTYRRHFLKRLKEDDPWAFLKPADEAEDEEPEAETALPVVKGTKLIPAPERPAVRITVHIDAVGVVAQVGAAAQSAVEPLPMRRKAAIACDLALHTETYRALPVYETAVGAWSDEAIYGRVESRSEALAVHAREEVLA